MKYQFFINEAIPLDEIRDSMQLDSNQTIAELKAGVWSITLEVRGQVRVVWAPDIENNPEKTEVYTQPSDFPDELMAVFAEERNTADDPSIFVDDNNWFEVFIEKNGKFLNSYVSDPENLHPDTLFGILWDAYEEAKKEFEECEDKN